TASLADLARAPPRRSRGKREVVVGEEAAADRSPRRTPPSTGPAPGAATPGPEPAPSAPSVHGSDVHGHGQVVRATAEHDAVQWAHVAVVSTPGERHVLIARGLVVGRIDADPAAVAEPPRQPRVRRIRARRP